MHAGFWNLHASACTVGPRYSEHRYSELALSEPDWPPIVAGSIVKGLDQPNSRELEPRSTNRAAGGRAR